MRHGPARTPLRRRLALTVLAAVLLAVALIGGVTQVSVSQRLTADTDQELARAIERADRYDPDLFGTGPGGEGTSGRTDADGPGPAGPSDGGGEIGAPAFLSGPGQGEYTLAAIFEDGALVEGGWVDAQGTVHTLEEVDVAVLRGEGSAAESPRTVELSIGTYRVQSVSPGDSAAVVVGISVEEQQRTLRRLELTLVAVGIGAAVLATGVGLLLIGRSLRPLAEVADVADAVGEQDLAAEEEGTRSRVGPVASSGSDEVARVSRALNSMLDHVDAALAARHRNEQRMARFVADASHELRTPLTIMNGYLDLLRSPELGDEAERSRALERVRAQTTRMTRLVEDLLLLNRLEQSAPPERFPVALDEIALDAVMDAQTAATSHRLVADFEDLSEGEARVLAGAGHVERILANLLSNAVKHTPAGTTVEVQILRERERDRVVLEVADDGPGMDEETLAHLFDRFSRADPSRGPRGGGAEDLGGQSSAGLGMALVQALARADGAEVQVLSAPGSGTRVRVGFAPAP